MGRLLPGTLVVTKEPVLWPDYHHCPGVVAGTFSDDTMISVIIYSGQAIICSDISCEEIDEKRFRELVKEHGEDPDETMSWLAKIHLYPYD